MNNGMEKEIFEVYLEDIIPNRFQPRLAFDDKSLTELANSIKEHGIIQPLVLRKVGDKYEIIAGERRYKASSMAGLQKVPAIVMNLDDNKSAELAIVENVQRQNLNAIEEAESYKKLLDKNYLTQEQLAARMGKTQATISNKLRLLNLDEEVRDALLNDKISERHARSLLSLKNLNDQKDVLHKIIDTKLTVKQTDDLIRTMTGVNPINTTSDDDSASTDTGNSYMPPKSDFSIPSSIAPNNIEIPVATPTQAQPEVKPVENNFPTFDFLNDININKEKEESKDINPPKELANIDNLMSISTPENIAQSEVKPAEPVAPEITNQNRFIPSFFDDNNIKQEEQQKVETLDFNSFEDFNFDKPSSTPVEDVKPAEFVPPVVETPAPAPEPQQEPAPITQNYEPPIPEVINNNQSAVSGNLKSAITTIREAVKTLERSGFVVDVEEFDFEHLYQMIVKINK